MDKTRAQRKAERKAAKAAQKQAAEENEKQRKRMLVAVIAVPIASTVLAVGAYFLTEDRRIAGLIGMLGVALWVPSLLGFLAAGVRPRDRMRAGSIDFGKRR